MEKLKVGQSFEVVELLVDLDSIKLKGKTGIVVNEGMYTEVVCKNAWDKNDYGTVALMEEHEVKPIGKLTITSIKKGGSDES